MIDDSRKRWNHRRCCVVGTRQVVDWKNSPKTPSVMNLWFYNEPVYKNWKKYDDQFWKQNFRIEGFIINHHPEVLFLKYESRKLQLQIICKSNHAEKLNIKWPQIETKRRNATINHTANANNICSQKTK